MLCVHGWPWIHGGCPWDGSFMDACMHERPSTHKSWRNARPFWNSPRVFHSWQASPVCYMSHACMHVAMDSSGSRRSRRSSRRSNNSCCCVF